MAGDEPIGGGTPPLEVTCEQVAAAAGVSPPRIRQLAYEAADHAVPPPNRLLPGRKVRAKWYLQFGPAKAYAHANTGRSPKISWDEILGEVQGRATAEISTAGAGDEAKVDAEIAELRARLEAAEATIKSWQDAWGEQRRLAVDRRRVADAARSDATKHLAGLLTAMQGADDSRLGEIYDLEDKLAQALMPEGPSAL
ncbi:hypothetical protein [Mycobacterium sp. AT1]|uniref:hypothetical protein n=1 Tax=Mycobacterium sp. AT1 TaxID=1961706 RepID=UPI0009AE572C|nr:hypothetical protein [Mycobacterium sp. AT1]OPX12968.1 hypothetical protein B1790_01950 [Mycobacterium sp. AT1]